MKPDKIQFRRRIIYVYNSFKTRNGFFFIIQCGLNIIAQILLREWLDYATERVPQIDTQQLEKAGRKPRELTRSKTVAEKDAEGPQRPRVFYRREAEVRPLIVARP